MSSSSLPTVQLKKRKAQPFYAGHPWVFEGAIQNVPEGVTTGDEVLVVSHEGQAIARGLYNQESQIRVRLYSWNTELPLDEQWWRARITAAIQLRQRMFSDEQQSACRLIFSEGDGLSGLIVDRFQDWLILQITSEAMAMRVAKLVEILRELLPVKGIWLRTEKGMTAGEGLSLEDGLIWGETPPQPLVIRENEIEYEVDLVAGQKTGFYFDQRDNRRAAANYLHGNVLDVCCYSGGFSLNALKHGAVKHVTALDSSDSALKLAEQNATRNNLQEQMSFISSNALKYLTETEEEFDGIVLDPPKFAQSRSGLNRALKAYRKWNLAALQKIKPGGTLVTCSCSGLVDRFEFMESVTDAALEAGRYVRLLEIRGQASDHPVALTCPESEYLKCLICAVD